MILKRFFNRDKHPDNKILFYSLVEGVNETYPIVPAGKMFPKWWKPAQQQVDPLKALEGVTYMGKCRGLIDMWKTGYVVRTWHTTIIEHTPQGQLTYEVNNEFTAEMEHLGWDNGFHAFLSKSSKMIPSRPHRHQDVFKFLSPWRVVPPKGVKLIYIPLQYHENVWFEAATGVVDCEISNDLNIQGWVTLPKGQRYVIPAGTPIAQIVPLTDKKLQMETRFANEKEIALERRMTYYNTNKGNPDLSARRRDFNKTFYGG